VVSRTTVDRELVILIASYLERHLIKRIAASAPQRLRVVYRPDLLPIPQYASDHDGMHRELTRSQRERWTQLLAGADVLFDFDWSDPKRLPVNAPRVRWVQATSAGIGEVVREHGLEDWDVTITTGSGPHAIALAEFVILGLLYLTQDVPTLMANQCHRRWENIAVRELAGQRVALVGLGHIGRRIAETLFGLGVEVWGMRRSEDPRAPTGITRVFRRSELLDVLPEVDALVIACPYTAATHHLISQAEFAAMRPGAVLANVARGRVVDEAALIAALRTGRLGGAVLDVFEIEPLPQESPLWDMTNVLVSPHGAGRVEQNERLTDLFIDNLGRYLDGRPLLNVFESKRGY
jgi:glyoxylate/hydroxypyruvate reductase A